MSNLKNGVFPVYVDKTPRYKVRFRGDILPDVFTRKPEAKRHLAHLIAHPKNRK